MMPPVARHRSTAARVDAAFRRLVRLQAKVDCPRWPDPDTAAQAMHRLGQGPTCQGWRPEFTDKEHDALLADLRTVHDGLGRIPWEHADG